MDLKELNEKLEGLIEMLERAELATSKNTAVIDAFKEAYVLRLNRNNYSEVNEVYKFFGKINFGLLSGLERLKRGA
tara:strand:+ start:87 stop:314 length:228 start_codon:yes stop_codon:yes gene_type:complete